jgi:hypothetical protein
MADIDLIVTAALGGLALVLATWFEERRIKSLKMQNDQLGRLRDISEAGQVASDRVYEHVRSQSYSKLELLGPALRAAISQYVVRAFVEVGGELTPEVFSKWLHDQDPALEEAWATVTPVQAKRLEVVAQILDNLRAAEDRGKSGVRIGKTFIPFGRPLTTFRKGRDSKLSLTARLGASRWNRPLLFISAAVIVVLGYPLLLLVGLVVEGTGADVFLIPILCAALIAYVLLSSRKVLREELSHQPEYGVYFAPGEIGSTISYVSFGEYSGATYFRPPVKGDAAFAGTGLQPWRRFSPNGLSDLGSNLDEGERVEYLLLTL